MLMRWLLLILLLLVTPASSQEITGGQFTQGQLSPTAADEPISAGSWTVGTPDVETQSVTVGAGTDRLFIVGWRCQGNAVPDQCVDDHGSTPPTLGGTNASTECNPAVSVFAESGGLRDYSTIFCWKDADIPGACSTSCTLDMNTGTISGGQALSYALWTGVDQTDAVGITCSNSDTAATNITCTLTGATSGNHNVATCGKNTNDTPPTFTGASPFTERTDHKSAGFQAASESDDQTGGASTADCTNTAEGSTDITLAAAEIND